jgi:(S)-citramalyl-CoA lyase
MIDATATIRPRRSFIFSPGLRPDMFPKALASGADIVCVELEDGIAPKDKAAARSLTMKLFEAPQDDDGIERVVRINCLREAVGLADVEAVLASDTPPPALMLPKVRTPDEVVMLDDLLTEARASKRSSLVASIWRQNSDAKTHGSRCFMRARVWFTLQLRQG